MTDLLAAIAARLCRQVPGADREALIAAALRSLQVRRAIRGAMLDSMQPRRPLEIRSGEDYDGDMEGSQC